jgi:hypothetical protein
MRWPEEVLEAYDKNTSLPQFHSNAAVADQRNNVLVVWSWGFYQLPFHYGRIGMVIQP